MKSYSSLCEKIESISKKLTGFRWCVIHLLRQGLLEPSLIKIIAKFVPKNIHITYNFWFFVAFTFWITLIFYFFFQVGNELLQLLRRMRALGISCAGGGSRLSRNFVKLLSIISVTFSVVSADAQHRQDEQLNKPEQRVETSTPMVNIFSNFHVNTI